MTLERIDLGRLDYQAARDLQKTRLADRIAGRVGDAVLFVEHDPVYTVGRRRDAAANVLAAGDTPVIQVERGGDVTWHGPGQLVAYPIIQLPPARPDLHAYLRALEEAVIRTLADVGVAAGRDERNTGAWVGGRKIASVGIACRRWVTWHGLALNVAPDLAAFQRIHPCGMPDVAMTSIAVERGAAPPMAAAQDLLFAHLSALLPYGG